MLATSAERRLNDLANVLVVDAGALQRVIKLDRDVPGIVPHGRCYAIRRSALRAIQDQVGLSLGPEGDRPWLLLVASPGPARDEHADELRERVLRAAFHALVHAELEQRVGEGALDDSAVRQRVQRIGRAEFEEIRAIFARDDQLLPPAGEREVYIEFCATYLELREFSPALLVPTFPGLVDRPRVDALLAAELDVDKLLRRAARSSAPPAPSAPSEARRGAPQTPPSKAAARGSLRRAERALPKGELAQAAIFAAQAALCTDPEVRAQARSSYEQALSQLSQRLEAALSGTGPADPQQVAGWREALDGLCRQRPRAARIGRCPEDRVSLALQDGVHAFEQPGVIVDVGSFLLSFGRRPVVRPRDHTRELQLARSIGGAAERARNLGRPPAELAGVAGWLERASARAEANARSALRPRIGEVLRQVGFAPDSGPEAQAMSKLVDELLDLVVERGFLSLPQLRDAVSRNEAKLGDLSGLAALLKGDPLLRADRQLEPALDGIYRRGDVYVRALQKASSLSFGNRFGRALSLYLALPALGAFTVLEAVKHLVSPLLVWLGLTPIEPLSGLSFALTSAAIFALIHSDPFRWFARQLLELLGLALAFLLVRGPRAILRLPAVRRWFSRPGVRAFVRNLLVPAALALASWFSLPHWLPALGPISPEALSGAAAAGVFLLANFTMASRLGFWLENVLFERLAPTWQALSRHWIPQLVRLIARAFSLAMDGFERAVRRIDSALRFQPTRSRAWLLTAGGLGALWAAAAYLARLYLTLLVEPEINPVKHFPVVTVAHKLILPFLPDLLRALEQALRFMGPIVGGTIAGVTVFLLPSVFGFLAWELKENYRLYRATRSAFVSAARLGQHGETMHGMLVPGMHSGTLPKLYDRLRRAAQRREEQLTKTGSKTAPLLTPQLSPELARFRDRLHGVERAVRRFAERELLPALSIAPAWRQGAVHVQQVQLSSNRIRVGIACAGEERAPCQLTFEHLDGWVVARISTPGFLERLASEQALLFENALAVFYHRAEVALVHEQIEAELGSNLHYQLTYDGLLVWQGQAYDAQLCYPLRRYRPGLVKPKRKGAWAGELPTLDTRRVVYAHQRVAWRAWDRAWAAAQAEPGKVERLLSGPSLLPPR